MSLSFLVCLSNHTPIKNRNTYSNTYIQIQIHIFKYILLIFFRFHFSSPVSQKQLPSVSQLAVIYSFYISMHFYGKPCQLLDCGLKGEASSYPLSDKGMTTQRPKPSFMANNIWSLNRIKVIHQSQLFDQLQYQIVPT